MHSSLVPHTPPIPLQLSIPNLRAVDEKQLERFTDHLDGQLQKDPQLNPDQWNDSMDADTLDDLAGALTSVTKTSAYKTLPITGAAAYASSDVRSLQHQRLALTRILCISRKLLSLRHHPSLHHSPEFLKQHRYCTQQLKLIWPRHNVHDAHAWTSDTQSMLAQVRGSIKKHISSMYKQKKDKFEANTAAAVHRMLASDAPPAQLYSVVNKEGHLTTSPEEMAEVMASHFEQVFSIPPPHPSELSLAAHPLMLFSKAGINSDWYASLMKSVDAQELLDTMSHLPSVSAPGEDLVSSGVWKAAIIGSQQVRARVCALFSACLRTSHFPSCWKTSVILPFIKKALEDRTMNNIRPISLQSCLGKLLNKILALRLGKIFAQHPILNPSQRGFVNGGMTAKCIDELLDAWGWSRETDKPLYTIFYDIKQAYDSVQSDVLVRAMRRLHMPVSFISFVESSLTGLTSCVRSMYGHSRSFRVRRSLRQGDPLAPLLFVILMDALHDGLHTNPFSAQQLGCSITISCNQSVYIPSLGFADDTTIITNTMNALRGQHQWVLYFMAFNRLRLNALKCEIVATHGSGTVVSQQELAQYDISVDGQVLKPHSLDTPIRYLGVHSSFNGSWEVQKQKAMAMINMFTRVASKFSMSVSQILYMFKVFLLPKLEAALHYTCGVGMTEWVKTCDRMLIGSIKHAVSSPMKLSHSAVALSLQLMLVSWLEVSIKVSELFIRCNSTDDRWSELGRLRAQSFSATAGGAAADINPSTSNSNWMSRAAKLAFNTLRWSFHLEAASRVSSRNKQPFSQEPAPSLPHLSSCTSITQIQPATSTSAGSDAAPLVIAQDIWSGFGSHTLSPSAPAHAYTDGSFSSHQQTSSWSVVLSDAWLHSHYGSIPSDEHLVQAADVAGACMMGAPITNTVGIYPAELQAIARALAMLPLTLHVHIHSDSSSSIAAIHTFHASLNERARLRMAARPILQLIQHLTQVRQSAAGSVTYSHVSAHTQQTDIDSVGNRLADYQAEQSRCKSKSVPLSLKPLPLDRCEKFFCIKDTKGMVLIDDIRQSAQRRVRELALLKWQAKPQPESQFSIISSDVGHLGQKVLRFGSALQQSTFVHIATNSIHRLWLTSAVDDTSSLQSLQCEACHADMDLCHLAECPDAIIVGHRRGLQQQLISCLEGDSTSRSWAATRHHLPLIELLRSLFPPRSSSLHPDEQLRVDYTCAMCGMFGALAESSAVRALGFSAASGKDATLMMARLSLVCLDWVESLYSTWKAQG
jgi:ribonuclease HI